jgi:CTP synthase
MPTKYIIFTGGVLSGLGKGIAVASVGKLLSPKFKVLPIKCDGYLNVDPGTMNPIEHGEVFVLDDGGEVDMDFGHYERFIGITCNSDLNLTMGKVFNEIRLKERRGDYLGKTVEFIPHVVDYIKSKYYDLGEKSHADIVLIEIGGTVGQIENNLYIEACRQMKKEVGTENIMYIHLAYVPIPMGVNEQKSKPTQQSVDLLRQKGITPDMIIGRCSQMLTDNIKEKLATFCDVAKEEVITGLDVDSVYKIPIIFEQQGIVNIINKKLNIKVKPDMNKWNELVGRLNNGGCEIKIAICGKYTDLEDSYASVVEALHHAGANLNCNVKISFIETTNLSNTKQIDSVDGIIVPGGFGSRGVEGKINIIKYCRENNKPFLGICYGMQLAVAEFARNVCGFQGANSTEINPDTKFPVIDILPEQKNIENKGGTMRLGAYPAILKKDSKIANLYQTEKAFERHRHRYEVNPEFHGILQQTGMIFSGMSPNGRLVEFIELSKHPYFMGCQGHPELKSSLLKPAPLFYGLVKAAKDEKRSEIQQ